MAVTERKRTQCSHGCKMPPITPRTLLRVDAFRRDDLDDAIGCPLRFPGSLVQQMVMERAE